MMGATVAQSGIPNKYPLAINSPLDRAYLRPLQEPLYDTEVILVAGGPSQVVFFQRPISQNTAQGSLAKTEAETNLNQSSMLDYPREFSVLGFNIILDSMTCLRNSARLYHRAWFAFTFSGRRPYLQIPLHRIPQGVGLDGGVAAANAAAAGSNLLASATSMGMKHVANYYKFNLGRAALKIKPGEAFNTKVVWPQQVTGLVDQANYDSTTALNLDPSAGILITSTIIGLNWSPL